MGCDAVLILIMDLECAEEETTDLWSPWPGGCTSA